MITATENPKALLPEAKRTERFSRADVRAAAEQHAAWLDSAGELGTRADFSGKNLEGADLVDARLADALLLKANLKGADLTLADLRDATLVQANLEGTNLLGTQLQQANLQAANLAGATGLLGAQLAGANLFSATLPETVLPATALKLVRGVAERAAWLTGLTLLVNALVWARILTTPDAQLVKNGSALPLPGLQNAVPFIPFYLFGPVAVLCLYLAFHLYLQRLWDGIAQLPAILPDGRKLDACLPWFSRWSARAHFKWLRDSQSPLSFLEAAIAILMLYWVVPATVLLFWGRYMTLEDLRGTALHVLLMMGAAAAALNFPKMAGKAFASRAAQQPGAPNSIGEKLNRAVATLPLAIGAALFLLSVGTFLGVPHDSREGARSESAGMKTWAPGLLWTIGYNPFAQLTEADVSTKPAYWTGRDEELAEVKGANLNRLRLRYIQAYGAFLAKARLWQTDLRNAYLSEADLREANLRQADLRFAVLDRAKLARAALPEANLSSANLDRSDLRAANLSFATLSGATFLDAALDDANLYKSDLHAAALQRASLKRADLREAGVDEANLTAANLSEAYLISTNLRGAHLRNADFSRAILTDANLTKADLTGAVLQGAVLQGADLAGANLQDADLRGAEGVTVTQACSAATLKGALLDDTLQQQVAALCGNSH